MLKIELIYDRDCPNILQIRALIHDVLAELHLKEELIEWDRSVETSPSYVKKYGSPTILINGKDVASVSSIINGEAACRVYVDEEGKLKGIPMREQIKHALLQELGKKKRE